MLKLGIERLVKDRALSLKGKRLGLLAHPASVNSKLAHTLDILLSRPEFKLTYLFGPEHGILGTAQDMIDVVDTRDPKTGLPVKSLYGKTYESLTPSPRDLEHIDALICDLQDIGTRYYTFAATIALCMQACAKAGKEVVVLDRPNPINGIDVEGKLLKAGFESFVGLYSIPVRHGMTMGEMALYFNTEERINCKLHVVKMEGWKRKSFFDELGLPWVLPSPNMPTLDTAIVYPGMCLIEATNLSEGRGTTRPFEFVGAPFIDPEGFARALAQMRLPGVVFRPLVFHPTYQKWAHQDCGGVQLHVTDRKKFKPYLTGIAVLKAAYDLYPGKFQWRDQPYEFVTHVPAIDLLTGDDAFRKKLEAQASLAQLQTDWKTGYKDFLKKRKKYLLY